MPASDLKALAEAKFGKETLSEAEKLLLEKVATSDFAMCGPSYEDKDNDPKDADNWGPNRRIRAKLVVWLCTDPEASKRIRGTGIQLYGADVIGALAIASVSISFPLSFTHCRLLGVINLTGCEVSKLNLEGSLVTEIYADNVKVKDDVYLRNGFTAAGVWLLNAHIGGDLDCTRALLKENPRWNFPDRDPALNGHLALMADGIHVGGNVYFLEASIGGEVWLNGAEVGGVIGCTGAIFRQTLNAQGIMVKGTVFVNDGFTADGFVDFAGAQIQDAFDCDRANFQAAFLALTNASAATLDDSGAIWPQPGKLRLDGFAYDHITSLERIDVTQKLDWLALQPKTPFRPQPYLQLAKVLREAGDDDGAKRVLMKMEELRRSDWEHGPIADVESWILKRSIGYGYHPMWAFWEIVALSALGWLIYRRSYLAGAIAPTDEEAYRDFKARSEVPPHYPAFSPVVYSVENSLPLVKLGQADKWQPDPEVPAPQNRPAPKLGHRGPWRWAPLTAMLDRMPRWLRNGWTWTSAKTTSPKFVLWFLWFQILLGWLLATLFVAGVSGIVHKE